MTMAQTITFGLTEHYPWSVKLMLMDIFFLLALNLGEGEGLSSELGVPHPCPLPRGGRSESSCPGGLASDSMPY